MRLMFTFILALTVIVGQAQTETEPNNSFEQATSLAANSVVNGAVGTGADDYDYFFTVLPLDGTMKIYVQGTNTSAGGGYLYMYGYDRRKAAGQVFGEYIYNSSVAAGATVLDTITVYGRASDTFYVRLQASRSFNYTFSYQMADTSENDAEPNNTFANALPINLAQEKLGHVGYLSNSSDDEYDYYKTLLPLDGTLKIIIKGTNNGALNGYLYLYGYDRRKAAGQLAGGYIDNSSIAPGATILDTISVPGLAADSFFFRLQSSVAFSYSISYQIVKTSENDVEPNGDFDKALPIAAQEVKKGHIGYLSNGSDDTYDYYKTLLPIDGTLKIYVKGTNRRGSNAYLYLVGYDKRKDAGSVVATYVSGNSSINNDSTIVDTITVYGLLADSFYFRVQSSGAFDYQLSYEMNANSAVDEEPNNTFEQASLLRQGVPKTGQVAYSAGGINDEYDYYKTVLPDDGTLKIYIQGTNNTSENGYLYMYGYDRRKAAGQIFSEYIASSSVPGGTTIYDTITVNGRAADTTYFRLQASRAFSYTINYEMVQTSDKDVEPNNSFEQAIPIDYLEKKVGHIGYQSNGGSDEFDYYRAVLPFDGTLKISVGGTNRSSASGYLYLYAYDRRKAAGQILSSYIVNSSVAAGISINDTLTIKGLAADTVYFRVQSSQAFTYDLRYEVKDTSENDVEPNDAFTTALSINQQEQKMGHVGYRANGADDPHDYYQTVFANDGTIKIYIAGTNNASGNGYLYMTGYDRRKGAGQLIANYIVGSSIPPGTTIYDTLLVKGRAADTFYFKIQSSGAFSYRFYYDVVDTSENDVEPNNTFTEALAIAENEVKVGHIGYSKNGGDDAFDYYKAVFPDDGKLTVYVSGTNKGGGAGYLYMYGYDRRKANGQFFGEYIKSSNTSVGATITDTIVINCRAADTIYFRVQSSQAFSYQFSFDWQGTTPNDVEPNDAFSTAPATPLDSMYSGRINYSTNGATDANDYYSVALPARGSVQVIAEGVNTSGSNGSLRLFGYSRRSTTGPVFNRLISNSSTIAPGAIIRDTITINCMPTDTLFLRWTSTGCFSYSFKMNYINQAPNAVIVYNEAGSLHEFSNASTNASNYTWRIDNQVVSTNTAPPLQTFGPGLHKIKLLANNPTCNFNDTDSVQVVVKGLDRYTPVSGGPGNILFTAYGGGFTIDTKIRLTQGSNVYTDSTRYVNNYGNIYAAIIDMHNSPSGNYDVEIINSDTTYFIPNGYKAEPLVDRLKYEILGRDVVRRNTNSPYSVRVFNEGNTMAGLVEVFVLFPSYMNVTILDSMIDLVGPQLHYVNLDTFPIFSAVTKERGYPINGNLYSFFIAGIPAGGFKDVSFMVNSGVGKESIYAWVDGPLSGSAYRSSAEDCYQAKMKLVLDLLNDGVSLIPAADCAWATIKAAGAYLYSAYDWLMGNSSSSGTVGSNVKTTAGVLKECAGEIATLLSLPAAGAPGAAVEAADFWTDVAVLGSNAYVNYKQTGIDCPEDPEEPKDKPVDVRVSMDPNAKSGPSGYKQQKYIIGTQKVMNYTVYFENLSTATLPAQEVRIIDTLDKTVFDLKTFRAVSFSLGTKKYPLPNNAFSFSEDVAFNDKLNVRLSVNLDTATGILLSTFKSIDILTGAITDDPLEGFLPPNNNAPDGEGNLSYAIDLLTGLPDGTQIRNKASIYFDNNEPITTDEWLNTLDANLPKSKIKDAYRLTDTSYVVKLSGSDQSSGMKYYRVYVSEAGGEFKLNRIATDSIIFNGVANRRYDFYTIGIDSVGNVEEKTSGSEAGFTITPALVIVLGNIAATAEGAHNRIDWNTLHEDEGDKMVIEKSLNGREFIAISTVPAKGRASAYTVYDDTPTEGRNYYRLKIIDRNGSYKYSKVVSVYVLKQKPFALELYPNPVHNYATLDIHGVISGKGTVTVVNMVGSVVRTFTLSRNQVSIDLSGQPRGTYLVRYMDDRYTEVLKITKQ